MSDAAVTGSFVFTPRVAATSVPVLSDALLVTLGLLLVVIAIRTLKGNRGYQKLLSVAVLAGGVLIGGLGAERTIANGGELFITGQNGLSCQEPSGADFNPYSGGTSKVKNGCNVPGTVKATVSGGCLPLNPGTCGELDVGQECVLPYFQDTNGAVAADC
jgi:hypothetical protein